MFITATQIQFRSPIAYIRFLIHVSAVNRQLLKAPGVLRVAYGWDKTLSAWNSEEDRRRFRNSGAHLAAMKAMQAIGRAKSVSWESDAFPSWKEARRRLRSVSFPDGKPCKAGD